MEIYLCEAHHIIFFVIGLSFIKNQGVSYEKIDSTFKYRTITKSFSK